MREVGKKGVGSMTESEKKINLMMGLEPITSSPPKYVE
jgi:hypothetical protein